MRSSLMLNMAKKGTAERDKFDNEAEAFFRGLE